MAKDRGGHGSEGRGSLPKGERGSFGGIMYRPPVPKGVSSTDYTHGYNMGRKGYGVHPYQMNRDVAMGHEHGTHDMHAARAARKPRNT